MGCAGSSRVSVADYQTFLDARRRIANEHGFHASDVSEQLYPFQREVVEWAALKGRAAVFADCGLGKTPMQLEWARLVSDHAGGPVLILAPLAVGAQTVR
jgi:superfamily II DNA or RNA helicase